MAMYSSQLVNYLDELLLAKTSGSPEGRDCRVKQVVNHLLASPSSTFGVLRLDISNEICSESTR
jgi:hypothetical protein